MTPPDLGVDVFIADEPENVIRPPEAISATEKGSPNGVATLDDTGHVPAAQLPAGIGGASSEFTGAIAGDGSLEVTLTSNWGIDPLGAPYYDPDGADPADAAWPSLDPDGSFVLTQLAGGTA